MSIELKDRQRIALEILNEFDSFCHKNNLMYAMEFGTLLGAVRHKGFIPWDDDIDVSMPRKDYLKLLSYSQIGDHLLIDDINDGREHDTNFAKVYDDRTYSVRNNGEYRCGIYIDIYPMDYIPDNIILKSIRMVQLSYFYAATKFAERPTRIAGNSLLQKVYNVLSNIYQKKGRSYYALKLNQCAQKTKKGRYMSVVIEPDRIKKRKILECDYFEITRVPFEQYHFDISKDYDNRLILEYGDYMMLPPIEERMGHSSYSFYYKG